MKTLKITLALITCFALNYSEAQTVYADSSLDLQVSVVYNSNMGYQVPATQDILFMADTLNNSSIIAVGNVNMSSTYAFDPATSVFPFINDTNGIPERSVAIYTGLNRFYYLDFGFTTNLAANISVTAAFNSPPNGTYCAYLKRLSTGEIFPILNDTVSLTVPVNTNFNADFILMVGPTVTTTGHNQTCYNDGQGGVNVNCHTSGWNYKIYNSSNNLIRQHGVSANDTTIIHLPQGNYTVVTLIDHLILDSSAFVVTGPAQIVPFFSVSNYSPSVSSSVNFTNGSSGAVSYSWDFGDGNTDSLVSTSHAYAVAGTYIITLTAVNGVCSSSITDSVQVIPAPLINPNNYTNGVGNRNDPNLNSTQRQENPEINVATDQHKITVSSENELNEMKVEILNMNGQLLYSGNSNSGTFETTVENGGIYILHATFKNGTVVSKSIMIL